MLSFTWISRNTDHKPTVVTIEFHERGTGTELVLTHRRLPPEAIEGHRKGWTDVVRLLDEALTRALADCSRTGSSPARVQIDAKVCRGNSWRTEQDRDVLGQLVRLVPADVTSLAEVQVGLA